MDNKEKNKQNAVSFENLKKLSGLISGSELSSLANYISKSKMALDTFCKKLKEHEINLKKAESTKAQVVKEEKVVEESQPITFKPVEKKPFDRNNRENRPNRDQENTNRNQNRDARPNNKEKPFNKDNKTFEKKPFVPRDNNGYKPKTAKVEIVETVAKTDRERTVFSITT